ncbi:hypothetical protein Tco_0914205 [Tanacetum coccineum]
MGKRGKPGLPNVSLETSKNLFPLLGEEDGTHGPMSRSREWVGNFVQGYMLMVEILEVLLNIAYNTPQEIRDQNGDEVHSTSAWMNFMVIGSPSQHNAIIGCSIIVPMESDYDVRTLHPGSEERNQRYDRPPTTHRGTPLEHPGRVIRNQETGKVGQAPERNKIIQEECGKIIGHGNNERGHFPSWLSIDNGQTSYDGLGECE